MKSLIIAVDFDNTIAKIGTFPEIVGPMPGAIEAINEWSDEGHYIIINTCRSGEHEQQAEEWLKANGINYDAINQNHPALANYFGTDSRKISADVYIDDKCLAAMITRADWSYYRVALKFVSTWIERPLLEAIQ